MEGSGVSKKDHRKETPVLLPAENGDAKTLKEKEVAKDVSVGKETQEPTNKGYYSKYEDVNPFIYHENIDRFTETEPFWKWLEGWTSSYVKKLVEHVLIEVKEDLNKRKLNIQPNVTVHETDTTGKTEADKKNTTDEKTTEYKRNITQTTKPQNTSTVITYENDENQDQDAKAGSEGHQGTVIPKVYSKPNLGKGETKLRHTKPEVDITSKVIYGNSVGNDKVTNIYVFYPRGTDEGIEKLKPLLDLVDPKIETERPTQNPVGVKDSETVAKKIDDAATFIKNETKHNDQIFNNSKEDSNGSEKRHEEKENPKDLNNGENFKQNTGYYNEANAIIKIEKNSKDESKKEDTIEETTKIGEELSTELEIDERTNKKEEHTRSKEEIVKDELNGPGAKAGVELHNKGDSNGRVEAN